MFSRVEHHNSFDCAKLPAAAASPVLLVGNSHTHCCVCVALPYVAAVLQKRGELEAAAAEAVLKALASPAAAGGDVLVFLPGVAELRRVQQRLQEEPALRKAGVVVQQLHGGLAPQQQDQVIR